MSIRAKSDCSRDFRISGGARSSRADHYMAEDTVEVELKCYEDWSTLLCAEMFFRLLQDGSISDEITFCKGRK